MSRSGEFDWISRYLAPLTGEHSFSLQDDAALLPVDSDKQLIVTQDAVLEGIHFLTDDPVDTIAQKALRVNVSDCLAKGANPLAYSLALGVPDRWTDADMACFAEGLAHDQKEFGIYLTGGDTYRSPERLCVSVTLFGEVEQGGYKSRLSAKAGDILAISGTLGNSSLGLLAATGQLKGSREATTTLVDHYRVPKLDGTIAPIIAEFATASMDISDGLLGDCKKLFTASIMICPATARQRTL